MKRLFLAFIFSILCSTAFATQYYINYGVGSDSNAGTSTGSPFNTCTPIEGNNFLKPGDIVSIFYTNDFVGTDAHCDIASAGTPSQHITINTYGGVGNPVFDGSVSTSSVSGWTGWTIFFGTYTYTVTSANATAGAVYNDSSSGNNFTVKTTISGSTTLVTTGVGAPAASGTLTKTSGTGDSTITYSANALTTPIYVSNVTVPFAIGNVTIDGSYSLRRMVNGSGQTTTTMKTEFDDYLQTAAGQLVYIELFDNSNPNSHTITFGRYGPSFRGIVRTDDTYGQYIDFLNITVQGAFNCGFSSSGQFVTFSNSVGQFDGREGFYLIKNAVSNATGAANNTLDNDISQYNNGNMVNGGNAGQGITTEAPYTQIIDTTANNNWMWGIAWNNYNTSTNASYGKCIRCIAYNNSQRAYEKDGFGFDAPGYGVNGSHNVQFIDSTAYTSGSRFSDSVANAVYTVELETEDPAQFSVYNIDIINNLIYNNNFVSLESQAINCSGAACNINSNIRVIGTTFGATGDQTFFLFGSMLPASSGGLGVTLYNDIFEQTGADGISYWGTPNFPVNSDYNTYFNGNSSHFIFDSPYGTPSITLAAWQASSGQDAHSQYINPVFATDGGVVGGINQNFHLSSTSSGQGSNSPALGVGLANVLGSQYVYSSIGTVLTNNTVDNAAAPAEGYHYLAQYVSSTFPSTQVGSDFYAN